MNKKLITVMMTALIVIVVGGSVYHYKYGKTYYYGVVGKMDHSEDQGKGLPTSYYYKIKGYNKNGEKKLLTVGSFAGHKFVEGRFIKVGWSRAKKVNEYEQVSANQIPKEAWAKLKSEVPRDR